MVLPIYAALERIPGTLIEASSDLGGRAWRTLRSVILPLALPGIAAGSIFTFSLTLGDYIMVDLVGGNKTDFIGSLIYRYQGIANDLPLAAAISLIPVVVITLYLLAVKRLGAFEAL
jgi:putative spermidine/putrescine transport system permease protein